MQLYQDSIAALSVLGGHVDAAYPLCPVSVADCSHVGHYLSGGLGSDFGVASRLLGGDSVEVMMAPQGLGCKGLSMQVAWDRVRALSRCPLEGMQISSTLVEAVLVLALQAVLRPFPRESEQAHSTEKRIGDVAVKPTSSQAADVIPLVASSSSIGEGSGGSLSDALTGTPPVLSEQTGSTVKEGNITDDIPAETNPRNRDEGKGGERDEAVSGFLDEMNSTKTHDKKEKKSSRKEGREKSQDRHDKKSDGRGDRNDDKGYVRGTKKEDVKGKEEAEIRSGTEEEAAEDPLQILPHFLSLVASRAMASLASLLPTADCVLHILSARGKILSTRHCVYSFLQTSACFDAIPSPSPSCFSLSTSDSEDHFLALESS